MHRPKVYIAGPEVFLPEAVQVGKEKKLLCLQYGFMGLYPFDNEISDDEKYGSTDIKIYEANLDFIRSADLGIFNLTPFRGISADVGTVFEMGTFIGMGKPIFAYSNNGTNLLDRIRDNAFFEAKYSAGKWVDKNNLSIEDFDNSDNLMLDCSLKSQNKQIHRTACEDPLRNLNGFVACLKEARGSGFAMQARRTA